MKRVVLVVHAIGAGGAERVMVTLANHWAAEGREVILLTQDDGAKPPFYELHPRVTHRPLSVASVSRNLWRSVANNARRVSVLRAAFKTAAPDVVISFMSSVNVLTILAATGLGIPVIVSERVDPRVHPIGRVWEALRKMIYRRASRVVCQSEAAMEYFSGKIRSRSVVIPNPVVAAFLDEKHSSASPAGRRTILAMGRLEEQKGFDLLIAAFSEVAACHPAWHLEIWGEGSCRGRLEAQIHAAALQERVSLCGITRDPGSELQRADLFVLSSRYEGFPNVLCEAMACGLPVIAFDCPSGPREIIREGIDGVLVPAGDAAALARAMGRLMSDDAERERLAACAPDIVARFGVDQVMAQWLGLVDKTILECGNRGRPAWGAAAMLSTTMQRLEPIAADEERGQDRCANGADRCSVLFVIRAFTCGGAERQLIELLKGIDKKRFLVTVATFYDGGGAFADEMRSIEKIRIVGLQKKGRWDVVRFLVRFVKLVREVRPDIVHGYMGIANELTLLARMVCGCRAVWGIRGTVCDYTGYNDWGRGFSDWVGMKLSRFADCIIVNSEAGRAEHVADGYEGRRMKVIRNGIDTARFCPDREAGLRVRQEWGVPPAVPLIGIVARLDPMKGHSVFMQAAVLMARRRPEVRFVCVGDGPEPYKARLQAEAAGFGLEGRLEWRKARSDVEAVYNALTILTSSSLFGEGFSNAISEAMACGTSVVATDVGDAAVIVSDPDRVVSPGCPEKLVLAWEGLLSEEPAALARRVKEGRERIIGEYSMKQLVSRTEAALTDLLEILPCGR